MRPLSSRPLVTQSRRVLMKFKSSVDQKSLSNSDEGLFQGMLQPRMPKVICIVSGQQQSLPQRTRQASPVKIRLIHPSTMPETLKDCNCPRDIPKLSPFP
jgi:hypothetical protein